MISNQQRQQYYTPVISTPIISSQQQQNFSSFAPPFFPHSTLNNTPTALPTTPYTIPNNYQQHHYLTTDHLGMQLDTTFTVGNGNDNNNSNSNNKTKNEDDNQDKIRHPASSYFSGDFSMDSLTPGTAFTRNQTVEENVHGSSTPLLNTEYPPPDLISNNLEFTRTMRKWVSAKEKDDDFFEEEQRYLKSLQNKRLK